MMMSHIIWDMVGWALVSPDFYISNWFCSRPSSKFLQPMLVNGKGPGTCQVHYSLQDLISKGLSQRDHFWEGAGVKDELGLNGGGRAQDTKDKLVERWTVNSL